MFGVFGEKMDGLFFGWGHPKHDVVWGKILGWIVEPDFFRSLKSKNPPRI
jgi:hypothetical protein